MAGRLQNHQLKGKLVEEKINQLEVNEVDHKKLRITSPAWKNLQLNGQSRVKCLSKVFEEKSTTYSAKTNWWLDESNLVREYKSWPMQSSPSSPKPRNSLNRVVNSPVRATTKLDRITNELIQKEISYIQALERGIDYYVSAIQDGDNDVPDMLRHQTFRLFGNIEKIYELHKDSIYPRLVVCSGQPQLIAETISSYIQSDAFYCYIAYAINQRSAEQLISYHSRYFEGLRETSDDLLGVLSFIIQPIQKLPRYKMFLDEMFKELSREPVLNKEALAAVCATEKNVQRYLTRLNEALAINDIIETREFSSPSQLSLLISMQKDFGFHMNDPMMLLVPKTSSNFPFRSPFNVYDLGKFYRASLLKACECFTGRSFISKVFIFEKCLMYTKVIADNSLGYRNHFHFSSTCSFDTKESQVSFRVCGLNKKHDVIFSSDNIESIAEMKKLINQFYDPRRSGDSAFVDGNELMIGEDQDIITDDDDDDGDVDDWIVAEYGSNQINLDETLHVANSRFYIKSPDPDQSDQC